MRELGLLLLRISMGGLMVFWGIDKFADVEHSVRVAQTFYMGIGTNTEALPTKPLNIGFRIQRNPWHRQL